MDKPEFNGKRITLPWIEWEGFEISPDGLHTPRGILRPSEIDLLFWKAAYYDRGKRV